MELINVSPIFYDQNEQNPFIHSFQILGVLRYRLP